MQPNPSSLTETNSLEALFACLCTSSGLYGKETFVGLYSCIVRLLREHRMTGFVLSQPLANTAFKRVTQGLQNVEGLQFIEMKPTPDASGVVSPLSQSDQKTGSQAGFLLVLTNQLCAAVYWNPEPYDTFKMYTGGWTFNPNDTRTLVAQFAEDNHDKAIQLLLQETMIDRRYDDKMSVIVSGLVDGLEARNRELMMTLDRLDVLSQKNLDTERLAAIGQLSSVVAHEIRNPLGLIDLYAKLAEETIHQKLSAQLTPKETEPVMEHLAQVRSAVKQLDVILSELTNYARPLTLTYQTLGMSNFVKSVCQFYQPYFEEKQVGLQYDAGLLSPDIAVGMDADKVRQALINLLKNALEVSSAGQDVTVQISLRAQANDFIYIKVQDSGEGISENHMQKLFTPYFSTKSGGTGLGLAHSRKIMQAHGGNVELLSTSESGSVFALLVPVTKPNL
ncbi:MAG: ATP-binding protein [Cyanobacteria bacterium P01_H01_bin.74]